MRLVGADRAAHLDSADMLPGLSNYFIGNDPRQWRTGIPSYARVVQRDAYRGIDVVYYGRQGQLEYDFIVAPRADPKAIRLQFDGADKIAIERSGALALSIGGNAIRMHKPVLYQLVEGVRREVAGGYAKRGRDQFGFRVGPYDKRLPLIIDPVMVYNTYLGGSGNDYGTAIAVDATGSAYIAGYTNSLDFPVEQSDQRIT